MANDYEPLKQRIANATPGPWRRGSTVQRTIYRGLGPGDLIGIMDTASDAYLVCKAPTDLEALLRIVEHYQRALEAIVSEAATDGVGPTASLQVSYEYARHLAKRALDTTPELRG